MMFDDIASHLDRITYWIEIVAVFSSLPPLRVCGAGTTIKFQISFSITVKTFLTANIDEIVTYYIIDILIHFRIE